MPKKSGPWHWLYWVGLLLYVMVFAVIFWSNTRIENLLYGPFEYEVDGAQISITPLTHGYVEVKGVRDQTLLMEEENLKITVISDSEQERAILTLRELGVEELLLFLHQSNT